MLLLGIDVQVKRDVAWAMVSPAYKRHASGWIPGGNIEGALIGFEEVLREHAMFDQVAIAIDAPRLPLPEPRRYRWKKREWHACSERCGRHCELVLRALRLANPQWTPLADSPIKPWMALGFSLFEWFSRRHDVYEVFPTASYKMLARSNEPAIELGLATFWPSPKDMLDAYVAAITLGEFLAGRGCEVGGGDRLGTIVLPRPCSAPYPALLTWPKAPRR